MRPSFFITQDSYQQTRSSFVFIIIFFNNFFNMEIHDQKIILLIFDATLLFFLKILKKKELVSLKS